MSKPLNATNYLNTGSACKILDKKQLATLGMTENLRSRLGNVAGLTIGCEYNVDDFAISVSFLIGNKEGLSDIYRKRTTYKTWQTFVVQGYPAVIGENGNAIDQGSCAVNVGVTNSLAFFAQYTSKSTEANGQSCEKAKAAAGQVVTSLIKYPNP